MKTLNLRKSPHLLMPALNNLILATNALAALASIAVMIIRLNGKDVALPDILQPHQLSPLAILNAVFFIIQSLAYDRYYDLFIRVSETSTLGGLLDVSVKAVLFIGTCVVVAYPLWLIPTVTLSYLVSNARVREVRRSISRQNPFYTHLAKSILPNNIRHTNAALMLCALWLSVQLGTVPRVAQWLMADPDGFSALQRDAITAATAAFYSAIFVLYWTVRMVVKQVVGRNPLLGGPSLRAIDDEVSAYLASSEE